jgi:PadR family transcriptional regulator, regulatory protein PadR
LEGVDRPEVHHAVVGAEGLYRARLPDGFSLISLNLAHYPLFSIVDYLQSSSVDSHSMGKPSDLVQGTLDLLILKTISIEPKHGWAIAKRIQQITNEVLQVQQGSLYPALHRLEQQGWIRAKWSETETGRQAKFYGLTAAGRTQLEREMESWSRLSTAINLVVEAG